MRDLERSRVRGAHCDSTDMDRMQKEKMMSRVPIRINVALSLFVYTLVLSTDSMAGPAPRPVAQPATVNALYPTPTPCTLPCGPSDSGPAAPCTPVSLAGSPEGQPLTTCVPPAPVAPVPTPGSPACTPAPLPTPSAPTCSPVPPTPTPACTHTSLNPTAGGKVYGWLKAFKDGWLGTGS